MELIYQLLDVLAGMSGLAALFAVVVNALKYFGKMPDGWAPMVTAGLNLIALIVLFALQAFNLQVDLSKFDEGMALLAQFGGFVLSFLGSALISRLTHFVLRGVPLIGTSYSRGFGSARNVIPPTLRKHS